MFISDTAPFLQSFFSLAGLYLFSYVVGFWGLRFTGFQTASRIHREFTRLFSGFVSIVLVYAIIKSGGNTVLLGLAIPLIFLFIQNRKKENSPYKFLPDWDLVGVHIFYLLFLFLVVYLRSYNPFTGNFNEQNIDEPIFGRFVEHLNLSGEENIFLDWYLPENQGNSFYHYFDLWGAALSGWFSGLGFYFGKYFVANPMAIILSCWAAFSFLESAGFKANLLNTLLTSSLVFFSPFNQLVQKVIFAPVYKFKIVFLIDFLNQIQIFFYEYIAHPKLAVLVILFFWALREFYLRNFQRGFLILSCIAILYSVILPPVILSITLFICVLIFRRVTTLKSALFWMLPLVSMLAFLLVFYKFSGGTTSDHRSIDWRDFFNLVSDKANQTNAIVELYITGLMAIAGAIPFLPFIFYFRMWSPRVIFSYFSNPVFQFWGITLFAGLFCKILFFVVGDSAQFWLLPYILCTIAALLWTFAKIFNQVGNLVWKVFGSLIFLLLFYQNTRTNPSIAGEKKKFFQEIISTAENGELKFAFFAGYPPEKTYPTILFSTSHPLIQITCFIRKYRPVCLTLREVPDVKNHRENLQLKTYVRNSEINLFVEGQIARGEYVSEVESKISFIRKHNINFAVLAADYQPDSVIASLLVTKFVSREGIKFCEIRKE